MLNDTAKQCSNRFTSLRLKVQTNDYNLFAFYICNMFLKSTTFFGYINDVIFKTSISIHTNGKISNLTPMFLRE